MLQGLTAALGLTSAECQQVATPTTNQSIDVQCCSMLQLSMRPCGAAYLLPLHLLEHHKCTLLLQHTNTAALCCYITLLLQHPATANALLLHFVKTIDHQSSGTSCSIQSNRNAAALLSNTADEVRHVILPARRLVPDLLSAIAGDTSPCMV